MWQVLAASGVSEYSSDILTTSTRNTPPDGVDPLRTLYADVNQDLHDSVGNIKATMSQHKIYI